MANTNCLEGIKCPDCGNEDEFRIESLVVCKVTDEGAEPSGEIEWDDDSWCLCPKCEEEGELREFRDSPARLSAADALRALVEAHDQQPPMLTEVEWEAARAALRESEAE